MGSDDSEVDNRDRVLAPDDLDITNQPEVEEIDDGRYVVSPNGPAKKPDRKLLENPDWLDSDEETAEESTRQPPAQPGKDQPAGGQSSAGQPASGQPSTDQPDRQSTPTAQDPQGGPSQSPPAEEPTPRGQPSDDQSTQRSQQPRKSQQPQRSQQPQHSPSPQQPQQSQPSQPSQQSQQSQPSQQSQQSQPSQQSQQSQPSSADQSTSTPATQSERRADQSTQSARSTGGRADKPQNRDLAAHDQPPAEPPAAEITNENVSKFLAKSLAQTSGDYGFDATVNIEGSVNRGRMTSDDIGETLETLLRWYAKQTTDEVEPEHVLGIILAGSDLAVEYPVQSAYEVVKQHGLGPDDSISDLLSAVRKEGSFTVPPSDE